MRAEVAAIGVRGTIAGLVDSRSGTQGYRSGVLTIDELVDGLESGAGDVAEVSTVQFEGEHRTLPGLRNLSRAVDDALHRKDAAVVTTGTNEMAELAYFLDLTVRSPKPVVVTGSMRPWNAIGSDAPANLRNAIALAASGRTAHFGTVVLANDQIFAAREVVKGDTQRVHAFRSNELGPLGTMERGQVRMLRLPLRALAAADPERWRTPFDMTAMAADGFPRVEVLSGYLDAGPEAVTAAAEAGVDGVVVAGTLSRRQEAAARDLMARGVVVVAANAAGSGTLDAPPEVIGAGNLHPHKARLLLVLALAVTGDAEQIRRWFGEYAEPQLTRGVSALASPSEVEPVPPQD